MSKYAGVVVDTLNLFHWAHTTAKKTAKPSLQRIVKLVDTATPLLRENGYGGRITFAMKEPALREVGRESRLSDASFEAYRAAAARNNVTILVATPDVEAEKRRGKLKSGHAAKGRDDFLAIMTAAKDRLPILSEDRYRDFREMKSGELPAFFVTKFESDAAPRRSHVTPAAADIARMRKPRRIPLALALPQMRNT